MEKEARLRAVDLIREYKMNIGKRDQMMRDLARMNLVEAELLREERAGEDVAAASLKGAPITDMPRSSSVTSKVERIVMRNVGARRMAQSERWQILDELGVVNYRIGQVESMLLALNPEERKLIELHYMEGLSLSEIERKRNGGADVCRSKRWIVERIRNALDKCEQVMRVSVPYIFMEKSKFARNLRRNGT